jgi:hypothetical protein
MGSSNVLTISGTRYATHNNPRSVTLAGVSRAERSNGRMKVRAAMDLFVRPQDIATIDLGVFTVDLVSITITQNDARMDVEGVAL